MGKEVLSAAETVSNEKGLDKNIVFDAIELALAYATKSKIGQDVYIRVSIDRKTGDYRTYRQWRICSDEEFPEKSESRYIPLSSVEKNGEHDLSLNPVVEKEIESIDFSRIDAFLARKAILDEIHKKEKSRIVTFYQDKIGSMLLTEVRCILNDGVILQTHMENELYIEVFLPKKETVSSERLFVGEKIYVVLQKVLPSQKKDRFLVVSRRSTDLIKQLFQQKILEIKEGIIEVKSVARDPGFRSKIALKTNDRRIDPIGICIGMRGERIRPISQEIRNEYLDLVVWNDDPIQLIKNALQPISIQSATCDESSRYIKLFIADNDQLARAIGKNGQNINLITKLVGYKIDLFNVADLEKETQQTFDRKKEFLKQKMNLDDDDASWFVSRNLTSLEQIANVDDAILLVYFTEEKTHAIKGKANDVLLIEALQEDDSLSDIECIDQTIQNILKNNGICSKNDIAALSVGDLLKIAPMLNEDVAKKIILSAREHWFKDNSNINE